MCLSDYLYVNFINPRYYLKFWFFARNPELWYGFHYDLTPLLKKIYEKTVLLEKIAYTKFTKSHLKLIYRIHGYKSNERTIHNITYPKKYGTKIGSAHPWMVRIAACYKAEHGVRWFHSTRILLNPGKNLLHPFTAKFIKDPYAILALLNKPGQNFARIQQLTKEIKNEQLY